MKEVFVIGAGASNASAGTPLGKDLVWDYHQDCCMMSPLINCVPDNDEENIKFANYIKFLNLVGVYYPEYSSLANIFLDRGHNIFTAPYPLEKKYYVDELMQKLIEHRDSVSSGLVRTLIFEHLTGRAHLANNEIYKLFCKKYLCSRHYEDISVISSNFDCLINVALDYCDGYTFNYLVDFDFVLDPPNNGRNSYKAIPLIKLNGSFDWGVCNKCNKSTLMPFCIRPDSYSQCFCNYCNELLAPNIIIPHDQYPNKFEQLFDVAAEKICESNVITIIGYSFPDYDTKIIDLFRNSIKENTRIIVIDYYDPLQETEDRVMREKKQRYLRLFPQIKEINVLLSGFESFVVDDAERNNNNICKPEL